MIYGKYRVHAVSGRPSPRHIIKATDRLLRKLIERTGTEI